MKNLYLLPTEKASRLYLYDEILKLGDLVVVTIKYTGAVNQHIYITSDEEIKEGDWFYVKTSNIYGGNIVAKCLRFGENCWSEHILTDVTDERGYHPSHCVKIILTTDQDLIKDGVQAIDDDFLEWFVKNPSCERVEVQNKKLFDGFLDPEYGSSKWRFEYKIIIPKEEPCSCTDECLGYLTKTCKRIEEEPKQETLEEAAENYNDDFQIKGGSKAPHIKNVHIMNHFIAGAKWQQERMYSEEEVNELVYNIMGEYAKRENIFFKGDLINNLFEQLKKK